MHSTLLETLRDWQNFYFMLGGAAATLIGLLFVAISLGIHLVSEETREDIAIFVTPILFHFVAVLITALVMLVPWPTLIAVAIALLLIGVGGLGRVIQIFRQMLRAKQRTPIDQGHWLWHALVPCLGYGLVVAAAIGLLISETTASLLGFALASGLLLVSGIWRAWDLVLWIAHQQRR
jgi:hypothetical protein